MVGEYNDVLNEVIKRYEEKTGNDVELVVFTDYNQPNEALESGDIDLNAYQHKKFLEEFNKDQDRPCFNRKHNACATWNLFQKI